MNSLALLHSFKYISLLKHINIILIKYFFRILFSLIEFNLFNIILDKYKYEFYSLFFPTNKLSKSTFSIIFNNNFVIIN